MTCPLGSVYLGISDIPIEARLKQYRRITDMPTSEEIWDTVNSLDYKSLISHTIRGHVKHALKLQGCRLVHSITTGPNEDFADRMEDAVSASLITFGQWHELQRADAILRTIDEAKKPASAVAEISVSLREEVITRAEERAAILQRATGLSTFPVVVGSCIPQPQIDQASARSVTVIALQHRD